MSLESFTKRRCSTIGVCNIKLDDSIHNMSGIQFYEILGNSKNTFASATDFFFKIGPRGWVGWEDASSPPQFLEYVFFLCDRGVKGEKMKRTVESRTLLGKGGGRP